MFWPSPVVSKTFLVLAFKMHTVELWHMDTGMRQTFWEWEWSPEGFSTSRSRTWLLGSGQGFGVGAPSFVSSALSQSPRPDSCCRNLASHLTAHLTVRRVQMEQVSSQGSVLQTADRSGQLGLQGWPQGCRLGSGRPREEALELSGKVTCQRSC